MQKLMSNRSRGPSMMRVEHFLQCLRKTWKLEEVAAATATAATSEEAGDTEAGTSTWMKAEA